MAIIDNLNMKQEALEAAINNFEIRRSALTNAYLRISNEVRVLDGTYHGEASERFKAQFEGLYANLSKTEEIMSNITGKVKEALAIYEEVETKIETAVKAVDTFMSYL